MSNVIPIEEAHILRGIRQVMDYITREHPSDIVYNLGNGNWRYVEPQGYDASMVLQVLDDQAMFYPVRSEILRRSFDKAKQQFGYELRCYRGNGRDMIMALATHQGCNPG